MISRIVEGIRNMDWLAVLGTLMITCVVAFIMSCLNINIAGVLIGTILFETGLLLVIRSQILFREKENVKDLLG